MVSPENTQTITLCRLNRKSIDTDTYRYAIIIRFLKKEATDLKKSREGCVRGFGEKKGKGEIL